MQELNSDYTPPTRKTLSGPILDRMIDKFHDDIRLEEIQDGIMMIDGWKNSNANSKNVVAVVRTTLGRNIFLDSWNFSKIRETGDALAIFANECIQVALNDFNIDIYAVITDNASNMKRMGQLIDKWHLTCNSHSGNLLFKSLIDDEFDRIISNIIKDFKSPNLESQLVNLGGNKMIMPGATRWCSKRNAYNRCLENINFMRDIIRENQTKDLEDQFIFNEHVIETILDIELENRLIRALQSFNPVAELVNTCQKSNCSVAVSVEKWLSIGL